LPYNSFIRGLKGQSPFKKQIPLLLIKERGIKGMRLIINLTD